MTMELMLAAALATAFVLMTMVFRRSATGATRVARKGRRITWDTPEYRGIGDL